MNSSQEKTLKVVGTHGSGTTTLEGNLLFKCGAVDMLEMESLQQAGMSSLETLTSRLRTHDRTFHTRKSLARFTSLADADCAIYLIDATTPPSPIALDITNTLKRAKNVVVAINKMDEIQWSKEAYFEILSNVLAALEGNGVDTEKIRTVPISALHGDNLIERPAHVSWYEGWACRNGGSGTGWTLMDAIDEE